ncbi:hypothetical protein BC831DRAFT_165618 [Entophlyctis helioformis]|nr:hypothetical protein BC831DRAFT_165618 [Entophlyctis helioformis]
MSDRAPLSERAKSSDVIRDLSVSLNIPSTSSFRVGGGGGGGKSPVSPLGNGSISSGGSGSGNPNEPELHARLQSLRRRRKGSILIGKERVTKHINSFIRVFVDYRSHRFPLTVDRTQTIEYVARQIEAEYAIRYIFDSKRRPDQPNQMFSEADLLSSILSFAGDEPLRQITQLYDAGNLAMPFSSRVGDLLAFDDVVTAVGTEDIVPDDEEEEAESVATGQDSTANSNSKLAGSVFELHDIKYNKQRKNDAGDQPRPLVRSHTVKSSTLDDRLMSVLHNIISMQFFNEFCLQEYSVEKTLFWIEVEIFKSISDPLQRQLFGSYIYLTYLAVENAPLGVNISDEVRKDIPWPMTEDPDVRIFDEAQDHTYAMIKGHAYSRYEKSQIFEKFLEFKLADRYTYIQGRVVWSFDTMIAPHAERVNEIDGVVSILSEPSSPDAQKALENFGNGKFPSIASIYFRQRVLGGIIGRYFPLVSPVIRGYFNQANRSQFSDRQKRIQKEKKLTKFFGQRPTTEHMMQQSVFDKASTSSLDSEFVGGNGAAKASRGGPSGLGAGGHPSASGEGESGGEDDTHQLDPTRRKKAEKLAGFFGESRLPVKKMQKQLGASGDLHDHTAAGPVTDGDEYDEDDGADMNPVEEEDGPVLGTQNELTIEERRALNRRARKLRTVLGETLDERTVSDKVTLPVVLQKAASTDELTWESINKSSTDNLALAGSTNLLDDGGLNASTGVTLTMGGRPSQVSGMTSDDSDLVGGDSNRLALKQRYDKLSHFLGHRISETDIQEAIANAPKSPPAARPLTVTEKKTYQKRSTKLERMLGSTVPAQAIVHYSTSSDDEGEGGRRSGAAPGVDVQETAGWTSSDGLEPGSPMSPNMVGYSQSLNGQLPFSPGLNVSSNIPPPIVSQTSDSFDMDDEFADEQAKRARQARLNKLRRMLGTDIKVGMVLEKQFLDFIEKSISESVEDPEERRAMTEDLERLKSMAISKGSLGAAISGGGGSLSNSLSVKRAPIAHTSPTAGGGASSSTDLTDAHK